MDASNDAFIEIGKVLCKHIDRTTLQKIVDDLQDVPGNKIFREAIERLSYELMKGARQRS